MTHFVIPTENNGTHRYLKYNGKLLTSKLDDSTGLYPIYTEPNKHRELKNIFGGNGDVSNICASFLLKFPTAKYSDFKHNSSLKGKILAAFKEFDNTGVLSTFNVDTSAPNELELSIYITISWASDDVLAETKANALIDKIKSEYELTNLFTALPSPFDHVILDNSLDPLVINMFVSSTIHSIVTNYNDNTGETTIEVKTVGLYDHMGIKINNEDDDAYRVLWTNGTNVLHIGGVDPSNDIIIATLFDKDNRKLYTLIQQPIPNTDGSYTVHYAIIDSNNIAINDVLLPVIVLNGNAEIEIIQGSAYVEEGATVTHNSGEYIVPVITGMVDVNAVGTYTVTYTATDSNGNTSAIHRIVHVKTLEPIIRRFVGSSSFGAYPNYINLADNTEGLTFLENNLDVTNYLQGSNFELTFACKFNANTWINGGKLIEICNGFQADVALYIKTQSDGSIGVGYFSGVYGSFGGFPLSTLTNYYLLFTYSKTTTRFTLTISERLDGTSPKYEYNDYLSNPPPYVPVTDGTRSKWLVGSTHSQRTWEYFDGSITDITISNKILTWEEVF